MSADDASEGPLPDLQDAWLDAATLDELFFDIEHGSELLDVRVKAGAEARAEGRTDPWSLDEARRALAAGLVLGVQLRYVHGGRVWLDTLLRGPEGTRLVRVEAPTTARR
ncbi:MAG: hypothetical protein KC657_05465 [Myxococcales bacterium]|nr:hypothetical protein [Myxococcales bacterium]